MKTFAYLALSFCALFGLSACGDDKDDEPSIPNLSQAVVGEWVGGEGASWTTYNFTQQGTMSIATSADSEVYQGVYQCDGDKLVGSYHNGKTLDWTVSHASIYVIRYTPAGSTAQHELNRVASTYQLDVDEAKKIDFASLLGNNVIVSGVRIMNPSIATYNLSTHEITGVAPGVTFAKITTDWGVAAVKIVVASGLEMPDNPEM